MIFGVLGVGSFPLNPQSSHGIVSLEGSAAEVFNNQIGSYLKS